MRRVIFFISCASRCAGACGSSSAASHAPRHAHALFNENLKNGLQNTITLIAEGVEFCSEAQAMLAYCSTLRLSQFTGFIAACAPCPYSCSSAVVPDCHLCAYACSCHRGGRRCRHRPALDFRDLCCRCPDRASCHQLSAALCPFPCSGLSAPLLTFLALHSNHAANGDDVCASDDAIWNVWGHRVIRHQRFAAAPPLSNHPN